MTPAQKLGNDRRRLAGIAAGGAAGSLLAIALVACATANEPAPPPEPEAQVIPDAGPDAERPTDAAPEAEPLPVTCGVGNLCSVTTPMAFGAITSVTGRSSADVWASATGGMLMRWNGQTWSAVDTKMYDTLSRLFVTPGEIWGVAGDLLWRRIEETGESASFRINILADSAFRPMSGVTALSNGDAYVSLLPSRNQAAALQPLAKVADFATKKLVFPKDPVYPATNRTQPASVEALFLVPDKALWLVGARGAVIRYPISQGGLGDGAFVPVDSQEDLLAAWGHGEQLWAVGTSGTILHFDGSSWRTPSSGTTVTLNAIFGFDANDIWAAGEGGTILHFDGTSWSPVSVAGYDGKLTSIWGAASTDVWIGGEDAMFHWGALQ